MADKIDPELTAWINREAAALAHKGELPGSPRESELLKQWHHHRPQMMHRLVAAGLEKKLALVLDHKRYQAMETYIQAGMPIPDAREQAEKDWLLMTTEEDDRNSLGPISTLMIQNG